MRTALIVDDHPFIRMAIKVLLEKEGFRIVAAFLSGLKDSHTFFTPPERSTRYDTGYRFEW